MDISSSRWAPGLHWLPLLALHRAATQNYPTQHMLDMVIGVRVLRELRDGSFSFLGNVSSAGLNN
jgi:hypothetical protein